MAKPMSFEAVLEEERKEILALLEGSTSPRKSGKGRASPRRNASPLSSPRSPVQGMLDIGEAAAHKSSPLASPNGKPSPLSPAPAPRSMLDVLDNPPPPSATMTVSATTSPTLANHRAYITDSQRQQRRQRSFSDAAARSSEFGSHGASIVPKRNIQGARKHSAPNAMAEVMRGGDISLFGTRDRGGRHSIASTAIGAKKSTSPHNRLAFRSSSPHLDADPSSKFVTKDGKTFDMSSAYRRLSDANLAISGTSLSWLGKKARRRTNSGGENGDGRLQKDYTSANEEDALVDSSDEASRSSDEEGTRGRKKTAKSRADELRDNLESQPIGMGRAKGPRTDQSLLAAAEEERQEIAAHSDANYKIQSLLDPEITITGPTGAKLKSSKPGVHPNTSFDEASGFNTPVTSDTEQDITDIKRAQKLSISMTPVGSTPATNRCVRTIYRGDFAKMQEEARENQRRVRTYLVATDLSDEAAHALEWTVGTVLRDGDTLLAVYCVDEEIGIAEGASGDDATIKEQVAAVATAAAGAAPGSTPLMHAVAQPSPLGSGFRLDSGSARTSASPMGRQRSKAEQERYRAVQDITDRVSKLLRKTKLQVKVVIEVIHCKSPKHLITEIIDYISPTLVILGSRGRNALKGVILGSFSNYIVTKSSVPVMVARKKLRKHTKYRRPTNIRLANNLANPARSLNQARID